MPNFYTKAFPNSQYRFELYANTDKESGETIAKRKGAVAWCNLGYFDMDTFQPTEGLIIDGKTLSKPRWHDWGVCIGEDGCMVPDLPDSTAGKRNFCAAVPPMLKHGKDAAARKDFAENGTTFIGFRADGTPVVSLCPRRLPCKGATSQQAVQELRDKGCVHVLRFDGSWSSQGNLGNGVIHGDEPRTVYSLLLIYDRNAGRNPQPIKPTGKTVMLDAGHYYGCANGNAKHHYKEDEFALDMSKRIERILKQRGIKVYQTRMGEEYVGLTERSTKANKVKDLDLFVSLHSNANPNVVCDGFGVMICGCGGNAEKTAKAILAEAKKRGVKFWGSGLFVKPSFSVLRKTVAPAVLIEHAFHSNDKECQLLKSPDYRDMLARIDADGIFHALGVPIEPEEKPIETPWYEDSRKRLMQAGVTDGTNPDKPTTRAEVWVMLDRMMKGGK